MQATQQKRSEGKYSILLKKKKLELLSVSFTCHDILKRAIFSKWVHKKYAQDSWFPVNVKTLPEKEMHAAVSCDLYEVNFVVIIFLEK